MERTGFLYDERYLLHTTGAYHPEISDRLLQVCKGVEEAGLVPKLIRFKACLADLKWIETVHDRSYVRRFEAACRSGERILDCPDNQMCLETYEVSLLAVGGILEVARQLMEGDLDNAFCAVRPPGHHAEVDRAMGSCYFNNVAIAARYLQQAWGIQRVGIVDFDVHHGNGAQHIFESDPSVFRNWRKITLKFCSTAKSACLLDTRLDSAAGTSTTNHVIIRGNHVCQQIDDSQSNYGRPGRQYIYCAGPDGHA